mmetsp:Transcript_2163/g.4648  ORF Transcript_2163/g.4648 Transcript_2163/m.4648 type:complete len:220 (-) Transcript_2163:165-824(-)
MAPGPRSCRRHLLIFVIAAIVVARRVVIARSAFAIPQQHRYRPAQHEIEPRARLSGRLSARSPSPACTRFRNAATTIAAHGPYRSDSIPCSVPTAFAIRPSIATYTEAVRSSALPNVHRARAATRTARHRAADRESAFPYRPSTTNQIGPHEVREDSEERHRLLRGGGSGQGRGPGAGHVRHGRQDDGDDPGRGLGKLGGGTHHCGGADASPPGQEEAG